MSRSIKNISEELRRKNLEHEKIHYKGKELTNLNSGENNDQYYVRRIDTNCAYFVKKGGCQYGSLCRFIHPEQKMVWNPLKTSQADSQVLLKGGIPIHVPYRIPFSEKFTIPVSSTGLPLRPGRPVCKYYSHFGLCKYGIGCQDDHPIDFKSVAVPVPVPQRSFKHRNHSK